MYEKNILLLILLIGIVCLAGCQKIESEIEKTNQKQETLAEQSTEAKNAIEIQETSSQAANINESESQKYIDLDEKNINLDADSDSSEKINKYMIPGQLFDITLVQHKLSF